MKVKTFESRAVEDLDDKINEWLGRARGVCQWKNSSGVCEWSNSSGFLEYGGITSIDITHNTDLKTYATQILYDAPPEEIEGE